MARSRSPQPGCARLAFDGGSHCHVLGRPRRVSVDQVRAETPFDLLVADHVETTAPPSERELEILRALDPVRQCTA